jgi:hypothetical protein
MLHGQTLRSGFTRLPGDLGDTRFILLVLEHGSWALIRRRRLERGSSSAHC